MLRLEIYTSAHDSMVYEYMENEKGLLEFKVKLQGYTRDFNLTNDIAAKVKMLHNNESRQFKLAKNINCKITKCKKSLGCEKESDKLTKGRTSYGSYCKFVVGQTYIGRCDKICQNISIIITKRTQQYVFYKTNTGITGKTLIKFMGGNEAILIKKANNLYVNSADTTGKQIKCQEPVKSPVIKKSKLDIIEDYIQSLKTKLSKAGLGTADLSTSDYSSYKPGDLIEFTLPDFSRLIDCSISNAKAKFIVNNSEFTDIICEIECKDVTDETLTKVYEYIQKLMSEADIDSHKHKHIKISNGKITIIKTPTEDDVEDYIQSLKTKQFKSRF